ncbi:type II toxin-antitoxin system VapC family toxin [Anaerosoma tenue]|uniref:type II toxin-antitoxin system VapC family toxin n=1 Tax=Anaerosoma tenue TaxID=2933588 RepID=UPI002260EB09|nr:type II toxin-antitoxin system VapC family toxin [Anaerosoma tenue]MCK8115015.1 type II toxin-antitoxin system VapC family toxin [Anaerosoma tenue]
MRRIPIVVLDASVGVKWFKPEAGSEKALDLLDRAADGEVLLVAPTHFAHEALSVVRRYYSAADVMPAWRLMEHAGVRLVPLTDDVVVEAARQCDVLGCSFYDALAPACAVLLEATLASADARAHGAFPGVLLIEE